MPYFRIHIQLDDYRSAIAIRQAQFRDVDEAWQIYYGRCKLAYGEKITFFECVQLSKHSWEAQEYHRSQGDKKYNKRNSTLFNTEAHRPPDPVQDWRLKERVKRKKG
jgi:hypothetical protein